MPPGTVPPPINTAPSPARTKIRQRTQCPETSPHVGISGAAQHPVPEAIGYHEAVVEAVCAADPDLAERSMVTLLRDVRSALNLV
jgi:DNA-binding FadR family transcriptional regulator